MKRRYLIAFFAAVILGTALHFVYSLLPILPIGMLAPVNESMWEHLKLLYWPTLAAGFYLAHGKEDKRCAWCGILTAILLMPAVMLGVYYTLLAGFGVHALAIDLLLYYLTMAGGFYLAYRMEQNGKMRRLSNFAVIPVGLLGAALALFTAVPPFLPIFLP